MKEKDVELAKKVSALAIPIWNEFYIEIIDRSQIDYMLKNFHSEKNILEELEKGYEYDIITSDGKDVGYCGYGIDGDSVYVSKFYISKECRGRGLGRKQLSVVEKYARKHGKKRICLRVGKNNVKSVAIYESWGFRIYGNEDTDIGGGFVIHPHLMEMLL